MAHPRGTRFMLSTGEGMARVPGENDGGTRKSTVTTALRNPGKLMKTLITGRVNLYNHEAGAIQAFFSASMDPEKIESQFKRRKSRIPC